MHSLLVSENISRLVKLRIVLLSKGISPSSDLLLVDIDRQRMLWLKMVKRSGGVTKYMLYKYWPISSSKFGTGQRKNSFQTPLGLHRVAVIIGKGLPIGSAFKARKLIGNYWANGIYSLILHRIIWLEGLQKGFNQGGQVDTYTRYIYIHGTPLELEIGRPVSHGCIHLGAHAIIMLADFIRIGSLVWIDKGPITKTQFYIV